VKRARQTQVAHQLDQQPRRKSRQEPERFVSVSSQGWMPGSMRDDVLNVVLQSLIQFDKIIDP